MGTWSATTSTPLRTASSAAWIRSRSERTSESPRGESTSFIGCVAMKRVTSRSAQDGRASVILQGMYAGK